MGPSTVTFQQGAGGYTGAVDTFIASATPTTDNSAAITITVDGSPLRHILIRFDGIFGNGAGLIPPGATILSATLTVNVTNASANAAAFHRMIQTWSDTSTWDSLVGGVQANGIEAVATADLTGSSSATGPYSVAVTTSVAAWSAGGTNLGWALLPGGTDGWGFDSSEAATVANRPSLMVTFTTDRAPDPPSNESPATGTTDVSTNPTLCVDVSDPDGDPLTVTFKGRPAGQPAPQDFTIIALPDTQFYAQSYPTTFNAQTQWCVDNLLTRNIAFVTQLGDCTNDGNSIPAQWTNANSAFSLLEDSFTTGLTHGIPYGIAVGNHDQTPIGTARSGADEGTAFGGAGGVFGGTTQYYNQTFGTFRFQGRGYFGDNYDFGVPAQYSDNMDNHFELFSASGMDFIAFHLEWDDVDNPTRQAVLNWVHTLLSTTYSSRRAIITSHYLLNTNGTFSNQGQATFNAIKDLPNVFLMLAGHLDQANRRTDLADDGHPIHTLLSDYQTRPNGGNGWLRILSFSPANDMIHVQTYSPTLGQFINSHPDNTAGTAQNDFVLGYDMDSGTPFTTIGTVPGVASGGQACASWPGRTTGQEYEWFAGVTDGELTTTGPMWTFTASCANSAQCDDAIACTLDTCSSGSCFHTPIAGCCATNADCADADPCTNDACNLSNNTCENTAIDCNDGRACTGPDVCSGGVCLNPYNPYVGCCATHADCDDGLAATTDTCVTGACSNVNLACLTNANCSDDDACTTDTCTAANFRSLVLDGVDDYVTMGAAAGLNASPSFTVEAWINGIGGTGISSGTQGLSSAIPLVAKGAPQAETPANVNMNYFLGLDVEGSDRRLAADFEDAATGLNHAVCSTATFPATGWHHVAASYSVANGWGLYVDGVAQTLTTDNTTCTTCVAPNCTTTPGATPEPNSIQHFGIGTSLTSTGGVNGRYQGKIDEVRVWNVERTATEITDARDELIATAPNLIAHYGFDDSTATDSAIPAENGTLVGSPVFDSADLPGVGGACVYLPMNCDDGDPCTADSCNGGSCLHTPANDGGACNDGNGCTTDDICTNGVCAGTLGCDDGNACTGLDQCVAGSCQNPYNPTPGCCTGDADCDDGNPGTADTCSVGTCSNVNLVCATGADCNDFNGCTADTCVSGNVSALNFDGVDDNVTMGTAPGLGSAQFTLETWFKRTGTGVANSTGTGGIALLVPLVTKGAPEADGSNVDANYVLGINTAGNVLAADFEDTATGLNHPVSGTTAIVNGTWYHAAATYDGTTWRLYLNGNLEATLVVGAFTPRSDSIQHAGLGSMLTSAGAPLGFFNGLLDEVRIWNSARAQTEIQAGMNQEITSGTGLLGRWGLNENTGTTANDSATSPTTENGTLTGGPVWSPTDKAPLTSGTCSYTPIPGCIPCSTAAECDDANACTNDACVNGGCAHTNNNAPCAEDGNPCTDDFCSGGACTHPNDNSNACADANACTGDACVGGACLSWYAPTPACCSSNSNCNDGVAATTDTCAGAPSGNCTNVITGSCSTNANCNDFNGCTTDACVGAVVRSALSFDGVDDNVTMGTAPGLGSAQFTLETWFKRTGTGVANSTGTGGIALLVPLVTKGAPQADGSNLDANYILGINTAGNVLAADFEDTATGLNHPVSGTTAIVNGIWYHAAATYDGTTWRLYLNGNLERTLLVGAFTPRSDSIQHAGLGSMLTSTGATLGFFNGLLDEVRIWSSARAQTEIQAGMNQEITSGTGLLGRWGLNENTGTTANDSATNPTTENGTLRNATTTANGPAWTPDSPFPSTPGSCTNTPIPNCQSCTADYQCNDSNSCTTDFCNTTNDAAVSFPSPGAAANRVDLALGTGSNASPDYVNYFGTGSFTIEGWVYTDGGAASLTGIFRGGQQGAFPQVAVQLTGTGNLQIAGSVESNTAGTQVDVTHGTALTANTWAHFAFVVDRTPGNQQLRLHLNGGAPATAVANLLSTNPVSFTSQSMIGAARDAAGAAALPFDGRLDEIRIWNYARTQAETAADMGREIASAAGLVHRWSFNEGSLTTAADSAGGITGTLVGAAGWSATNLPFAGSDSCTHTSLANGASCSDGNECTQSDSCQAGTCASGSPAPSGKPCGSSADTTCDNFDTCNGAGACQTNSEPNGTPCSDGNACNGVETCQSASCTAGTPVNCDDNSACTTDACNPATGTCSHVNVVCNDNSACTTDTCDPVSGCVYTPVVCDDGNACNGVETCSPTSGCQAGTPVNCDDGVSCTVDACDETTDACTHTANNAACDDGSLCTTDSCNPSSGCVNVALTCTALDQCHDAGICDPATGLCSNPAKPNGAPCMDSNVCTQSDTCQAGTCTGSNPVTCVDDGNPCTDETCDSIAGCSSVPNSAVVTCYTGPAGTQGVGTCHAGTATCSAGSLGACVGEVTPVAEICDGADNDCDGAIDEAVVQVSATCSISPATLNVNANGPTFSMGLTLYNVCGGGQIPLDASQLGPAYISRAADLVLPDPTTLICSDPLGERGIVDNPAARSASGNTASLRFDKPSDGLCATLDGNRQDLNALLAGVPNNTNAQVCVASRISGAAFECCVNPNVRNRGLR